MKSLYASLWLAAPVLILVAPIAAAQGNSPPSVAGKRVGLMFQADLDFGGDDLATVSFTNGDSQDVKAGQGIVVSGGLHFRPIASSPFDVQALVGYKYVTTAASNADIKVTRVVMQLLGDYQFSNGMYLGGGLVRHTGTELDGDGFFRDIEFDDAAGFTVQTGWRWVGLHYTRIEYENSFIREVDASHVGLRFNFKF